MARELAPAGARSVPKIFRAAVQPSGSKLPRHKSPPEHHKTPRHRPMPGRFAVYDSTCPTPGRQTGNINTSRCRR
ncbi:hypothetical protein C1X35_00110 [Pseudomonas sp. FW306-1C-G01A]|nr:hypothetical protein [Pseudomonas mandelii]PMV92253.1 hypothetical protein C1X51_18860 [Pseudomonas sp. FW306-2-2C-B10A]PMV99956.1 hypothetical protein C1X55_10700 [Pseudomonas sp. GW460-C8]PMW06965.1 hypothetical protein C1X50_06810 [Pseudomonas sp. MPR-TSA4]PMW10667.1 hypothetical protein C1X52_22810 [Pseudomonas sp. FW306-2-1A-C05A]PMW24475.1 hypothetical protein C1X40_03660 [Pseudomonas sp. GW456-11-11-14-TSB2]PMW39286.1 hypothetical protein C1X45_10025 [Pseudomonas sp. GW460-7]PMW399